MTGLKTLNTGKVIHVFNSNNCIIEINSKRYFLKKPPNVKRLEISQEVIVSHIEGTCNVTGYGSIQQVTLAGETDSTINESQFPENDRALDAGRQSLDDMLAELNSRHEELKLRESDLDARESILQNAEITLEERTAILQAREERNQKIEDQIPAEKIRELGVSTVTDDNQLLKDQLTRDLANEDSDFRFSRSVLATMIASIAGQLVLFAGPPGAGKSTLARQVAHNLEMNFQEFSVRPGWIDATDLFGFPNINGDRFLSTQFLRAMITATEKPEKLHALLLEEVNLARIENYAADLLVALEGSSKAKISLYSSELVSIENREVFPPQFDYPSNVLILGTLNHDESTMRLSPKVKDRSIFVRVSFLPPEPDGLKGSNHLPLLEFSPRLVEDLRQESSLSQSPIQPLSGIAKENFDQAWAGVCELQDKAQGNVQRSIVISARTFRCINALASLTTWLELDIRRTLDLFLTMKILPWLEFYTGNSAVKSDLQDFESLLNSLGFGYSASEVRSLYELNDDVISYLR